MMDFEKSASDPRRLFESSFRLLEEEKFRKNGLPTLMNMEAKLKKAVLDYETGMCVIVISKMYFFFLRRYH